jgi:hypothetical protein
MERILNPPDTLLLPKAVYLGPVATSHHNWIIAPQYVEFFIYWLLLRAGIAQSVYRLSTDWTTEESEFQSQ